MLSKKEAFDKWISEGLEKGYVQALDKHLRLQYGIKEQCSPEQWEDAKEHFLDK